MEKSRFSDSVCKSGYGPTFQIFWLVLNVCFSIFYQQTEVSFFSKKQWESVLFLENFTPFFAAGPSQKDVTVPQMLEAPFWWYGNIGLEFLFEITSANLDWYCLLIDLVALLFHTPN